MIPPFLRLVNPSADGHGHPAVVQGWYEALSQHQEDLIFQHNGKNLSLEIKNNPSDPDWGQCELIPTQSEDETWVWN